MVKVSRLHIRFFGKYFLRKLINSRDLNNEALRSALFQGFSAPKRFQPSHPLGLPVIQPIDIINLTESALLNSKSLFMKIKNLPQSFPGKEKKIVDLMDEISNEICKVADWAECIRNVHSNIEIKEASKQSRTQLSLYVEQLNSDKTYYNILKQAMKENQTPSKEVRIISQSLIEDFESSGVHLGEKTPEYLKTYQKILQDSDDFVENCSEYYENYINLQSQFKLLNLILENRRKIANLLGYSNYADYILPKTMAGSLSTVRSFLSTVITESQFESLRMSDFKNHMNSDDIFFPLYELLSVLNDILKDLFGVSFEIDESQEKFVWSSTIIRFQVKDSSFRAGGIFYLDLFRRQNKPYSNSHYTILGRKGDVNPQYPSIYLCLNIPLKMENDKITTTLNGAKTLFHEMGHCIHSLLYDGKFQHLSGTRCSTDLAEIPSHFFEKFLTDKSVIRSIFPNDSDIEKKLKGIESNPFSELFRSAINAYVDLSLNSISGEKIIDSKLIIKSVLDKFLLKNSEEIMNEFRNFSHLIHYPSKYYSYLWAQGCTNMIWKDLFQSSAFNNLAGSTFRSKFLSKGGTCQGFEMMQHIFGYEISSSNIAKNLVDQ